MGYRQHAISLDHSELTGSANVTGRKPQRIHGQYILDANSDIRARTCERVPDYRCTPTLARPRKDRWDV